MIQQQITKQLANLYEDVLQEYKTIIEQSMAQVKMYQLPADQWLSLQRHLSDNKMKLDDFKAAFPLIILRFLQKVNEQIFSHHPFHNIHEMQHTGDLLQKSFFNFQIESVSKFPILVELVLAINQKVKLFFFRKRDQLQEILQTRKQIKLLQQKQPKKKFYNEEGKVSEIGKVYIDVEPKAQKKQDSDTVTETTTKKKVEIPIPIPIPKDFSRCLCAQLLRTAVQITKFVECKMCHKHFHQTCIKSQKLDVACFVCPQCTILNLDLFSPVQEVICPPSFFQLIPPSMSKVFQFYVKDIQKSQAIQFRCLRVDEYHGLDEPTWPDYGDITVNGTKIYDFKPLAINTSLKKRKDCVLILKEKINLTGQANFVTLRELKPLQQEQSQMRILSGQTYMAGIFVVQVLNSEKLIKIMKKDASLWLSIGQGKELIREKQNELQGQVDGVEVDRLKVSLACPFTTLRIETPARGHLCTHVQCFCLENMIKMTFNAAHRKWRCPICKRKCFKMFLDGYQLSVMAEMKDQGRKDKDITFMDNGEVDNTAAKSQLSSLQPEDQQSPPKIKKQMTPSLEIVIDEDQLKESLVKKIKHQTQSQFIQIDDE